MLSLGLTSCLWGVCSTVWKMNQVHLCRQLHISAPICLSLQWLLQGWRFWSRTADSVPLPSVWKASKIKRSGLTTPLLGLCRYAVSFQTFAWVFFEVMTVFQAQIFMDSCFAVLCSAVPFCNPTVPKVSQGLLPQALPVVPMVTCANHAYFWHN